MGWHGGVEVTEFMLWAKLKVGHEFNFEYIEYV